MHRRDLYPERFGVHAWPQVRALARRILPIHESPGEAQSARISTRTADSMFGGLATPRSALDWSCEKSCGVHAAYDSELPVFGALTSGMHASSQHAEIPSNRSRTAPPRSVLPGRPGYLLEPHLEFQLRRRASTTLRARTSEGNFPEEAYT